MGELRIPVSATWGQVVVNISQTRSAAIAQALIRRDFRPMSTAGRASRKEKPLYMGGNPLPITPASEMIAPNSKVRNQTVR